MLGIVLREATLTSPDMMATPASEVKDTWNVEGGTLGGMWKEGHVKVYGCHYDCDYCDIHSIVHHLFTDVNTQPKELHVLYYYILYCFCYILVNHSTVVAEQIVYICLMLI